MPERREPECPEGRREAVIDSALQGGEPAEALARHVEGCRPCARGHVQAAGFLALERRVRSSAEAGAAGPERGLVRFPRRRWTVAAACLLVVAGAAGGALLLRPGPILVGSGPGDAGGLVGEIAARSRMDFAGAGIGPGARVLEWASFVLPGGRLGTAAMVQREDVRSPDLVAFAPEGAPLWVASRDWGIADLLGEPEVVPLGLRNLVTDRRGGEPVETLALLLGRKERCLLLLVDPRTGRLAGRLFHQGVLTSRGDAATLLDVLPAGRDGARTLLAGGQYRLGGDAAPCLLVVAPDGVPRQHLRLPTVGLLPSFEPRTVEMRVDWSADRPSVTVATSEHLLIEFPVRDGLLDAAGARVRPGDDLRRAYHAKYGAEAWDALLVAAGGEEGFRRGLAARIAELPLAPPAGWRDR